MNIDKIISVSCYVYLRNINETKPEDVATVSVETYSAESSLALKQQDENEKSPDLEILIFEMSLERPLRENTM